MVLNDDVCMLAVVNLSESALMPTLAQSAAAARAGTRGALLIAGMIMIVMILGAALMIIRKKLLDDKETSESGAGFLEELRAMHRRGELSDAEFQRARDRMRQSMQRVIDEGSEKHRAKLTKRQQGAGSRKHGKPTRHPPSRPGAGASSDNSGAARDDDVNDSASDSGGDSGGDGD